MPAVGLLLLVEPGVSNSTIESESYPSPLSNVSAADKFGLGTRSSCQFLYSKSYIKCTGPYILDYEIERVQGIHLAVAHEYDMRAIVFAGSIIILLGICIRRESPLAIEVYCTRL